MTDTLIIMFFGVFAVVWLISGFLTLRNQQDVLGRPPIAGGWFLLGKLTMGVSWGCLRGAALGMHRPIGAYSGYTDWLSLLFLTVAMVFVATSFFVLGAANKFGLPQEKTVLKTKGVYARYPLTNDERFNCDIWELSQPQSKNKTHAHTIDTGCAFIMLDGASYVYELFKTPALKELVEEMIDRFVKIDLAEVKMQTHATLTATRGILRFYKTTGSKKYLEIAEGIFNFYKSNAWTENYSNYNWFGDPRWTEPCAIIDSFIVATWLWQYTQNPEYLEDAHHIYYNAICHGQRTQGEFGTDNCVGVKEPFIYPFTYEVYWCCSMRAGECFAKAIEFNYFLEGDTVFVPFYNDSIAKLDFEDGSCVIRQCSEYPYGSNNKFKIEESDIKTAKTFKFFVPSWINEKGFVNKHFNWQGGFGAFSYAKSELPNVIRYIENQEVHHNKTPFLIEYTKLLQDFDVEYDERYIYKPLL